MKSSFLLLIAILIFKSSFAQISLASFNDFEDGTTMGWQVGGAGAPPVNIPTGGPNGSGDHFLRSVSDGSGPNGRLVIFNLGSTWTGDWTTAGVIKITFMAKNPGATNLTLRISLDGGGGRISVTNGVLLAAGSGWTAVTIPVTPANFTLAGGFNIASTLSAVSIMRIIHSTTPSWQGTSIVATLDLDVISSTSIPPANDEAPGAILLTVGSGCSGFPFTNSDATQSVREPFAACKGTAGYKTVWYKFVAPASGNIRVSNDYSGGTMGNDSRLALFSATDVNDYLTFTNLACDDDNGVAIAERSILYATGLNPGDTYYIQVDGKDASTTEGTFCLTVDEMTSPMLSTATACASGQPLMSVNDNYSGWLSSTDVNGKLISLINNTSGGATTSTYGNNLNINAGPVRQDPVSLQYYLDRNFQINNPDVTNVNVRFFFLNSELASLQSIDPGVTLANLQLTRQTGSVCDNIFTAANGSSSSLTQISNGSGIGFNWIEVIAPGFSKFFLHTKKAFVLVKTFLHGAYTTSLSRHKDVTTAWAAILNANALSQPYNIAPFNYTGTENVSAGFFTSTASNTDITDWVLLEIRDATTPSTVITRRAAFIREDGRIVDLDGVSDISFRTLTNGPYHVVIRHRNHLAIRTSATMTINGTMGFAAPLYNFSLTQTQAYQNPSITTNTAMRDLTGGVFGMWGGNGNGDIQVRATGPLASNDYGFLITTTLGGNVATIISNVYHRADLNMDGQVRATGPLASNDYGFLITNVLAGNVTTIISQHQ